MTNRMMLFEMLDFNMLSFTSWTKTKWVLEKLRLYRKYKSRKRIHLPPCQSRKGVVITPTFCLGFCVFKQICVAKLYALQTVALNVPGYGATLALYILITQACSDFYYFSSLSYYGNITSNNGVS